MCGGTTMHVTGCNYASQPIISAGAGGKGMGDWIGLLPKPLPLCNGCGLATGYHLAGCANASPVHGGIGVTERELMEYVLGAQGAAMSRESMCGTVLMLLKDYRAAAEKRAEASAELREYLRANWQFAEWDQPENVTAMCKAALKALKAIRVVAERHKPGDTVWLLSGGGPFVVASVSETGLKTVAGANLTPESVTLLTKQDGTAPRLPYPKANTSESHCWRPGWIRTVLLTKTPPEPPPLPWWRERPALAISALASIACAVGTSAIVVSYLLRL